MTIRRLITKKEFATLAGVSQPAVSKLCKGKFELSIVGGQIDLDSPIVIAYLEKKQVQHADVEGRSGAAPAVVKGHAAIREAKKHERLPPGGFDVDEMMQQIPEDIRKLANWKLRDLIQKFGTDAALKDWLAASKIIEDIHAKRVANSKSEGELVDKRLVALGILDPLNTCHTKMLTDGAKSIATRSKALADSGADVRDIEKMIVDRIQSFIKPMKAAMKRGLDNFEA